MSTSCTEDTVADFSRVMGGQMLRVNVLLMGNVILMGVMVGMGAYGHRYHHHPLTRFLFLSATILFLPIVSYIVSITSNQTTLTVLSPEGILVIGQCHQRIHHTLVLVWTAFVQIVGINTTAIVAADAREGRSIAPPTFLLVQAIWTSYLGVTIMGTARLYSIYRKFSLQILAILSPFALIFAKLFLKYYAWYNARQSFAFGRNPRLIVGYMEQLPTDRRHYTDVASEHTPPPLIVSREDTMLVKKQPHGYRMCNRDDTTRINYKGSLVTIDKVWELDDMHLKSITQLKDVCFSLALFKMLRCRFAKYTITEAGFMKTHNFLCHVLLEDSNDKRILGMIVSELSFLHDYYYSSLPISYSMNWQPILSILISLVSIGYCLSGTIILMPYLLSDYGDIWGRSHYKRVSDGQMVCFLSCMMPSFSSLIKSDFAITVFGSVLFDALPVISLGGLVVLSEVREIASYICSDWTKVALMCRYVSWHGYPTLRKWIVLLLQCMWKLEGPWQDKMDQCSILVRHPRKTPLALLRRFIPLPEQKKNIKVPAEVKTAIISTLRSTMGDLSNGIKSAQQLGIQVGDNFLRACNAKGTSDALLAWHVATSILEVRYPRSQASSDNESVATKLSRYCAYLVAYCPELLPDDDAWSSGMYKATKKDAERVLAAARIVVSTPEMEYRQLVDLLSTRSKHDVLKDGAKLGEQLVELMEGEEAAWEALAGFWCEAILYIAPSKNLDGHAEAIARGGELITLLWALLAHLGVDRRPEATAASTTMDASGIV